MGVPGRSRFVDWQNLSPARRAVVTGVGTGIGRAIAERLLDDDWEILGVYNTSAGEAQRLADESSSVELLKADLSSQAGVERVIDAAAPQAPKPS